MFPKSGKFLPYCTSGHDTSLLCIVMSQAADPQMCLELYWLYQGPSFPDFSENIANEVLSDTVFIKALVTLKIITISRYTRKDYFVHTLQKIAALPEPIFKKLAKIQQHSVQITHIYFHPHCTINVERVDIKLFAN